MSKIDHNTREINNYISHIFYINLEHRIDRNQHFLDECVKMGIPSDMIERYNAVYIPSLPGVGCTTSHLEVLKLARSRGYKNVLIFEDDFTFIVDKDTLYDNISRFFELDLDWRVLMFAYFNQGTIKPYGDFLSLTDDCQTASGYLVNSKYFDELIQVMEEGLQLLTSTGKHWLYVNDQYWKKLQKDDKWFFFTERIGKQYDSYSDLSGGFVSYNV